MNLRIFGVGAGDEVIVPAFTYTATAINEKTKAIVAVDLDGIIADNDRIYQVAENKKLLFTPANKIQKTFGRVAVACR